MQTYDGNGKSVCRGMQTYDGKSVCRGMQTYGGKSVCRGMQTYDGKSVCFLFIQHLLSALFTNKYALMMVPSFVPRYADIWW